MDWRELTSADSGPALSFIQDMMREMRPVQSRETGWFQSPAAQLVRADSLQSAPPEALAWWQGFARKIRDAHPAADSLALYWLCSDAERTALLPPPVYGARPGDPFWLLYLWVLLYPTPQAGTVVLSHLEAVVEQVGSGQQPAAGINVGGLVKLAALLESSPRPRCCRLLQAAIAFPRPANAGPQTKVNDPRPALGQALTEALVPLLGAAEVDLADQAIRAYPGILQGSRVKCAPDAAAVRLLVNRHLAQALTSELDEHGDALLRWYPAYAGLDDVLAACRNLQRHPKEKPSIDPYVGQFSSVAKGPLDWSVVLLRRIKPPTAADMVRAAELAQFPPEVLVTASLYATAWGRLVERVLDWPGLGDLVGWLKRYGGPAPWSENYRPDAANEEEETGAVDRETALAALGQLGPKRLRHLFGHRTTKGLYRDGIYYLHAIAGENAADVDEGFVKRNKRAVRALGMLPDEGDILQRYLALRRFAKEARQFGAKRQASEQLAAETGLANLALTAGYSDTAQLEWAMEARLAQEMDPTTHRWELAGYHVGLAADDKATLIVERDGKRLKSVPPAVRKDPGYADVTEARAQLQAQWERVRRRLEVAMAFGEVMGRQEFAPALITAAGRVMVPGLVLRCWLPGAAEPMELLDFQTCDGQMVEREAIERFQVAHPLDLTAESLTAWQRQVVARRLVQPFNQLFRECYRGTLVAMRGHEYRGFTGRRVRVGALVQRLKRHGWQLGYEGQLTRRLLRLGEACLWFQDGAAYQPALDVITVGGLELPERLDPRMRSELLREVDLATMAAAAERAEAPVSPAVLAACTELAAALGDLPASTYLPYPDPDPATAAVISRLLSVVQPVARPERSKR